MHIRYVAERELKLGFRNPWFYSFLSLFSLFCLALLLVQSQTDISGFTGTTSAVLNLTLMMLPLMTLLLGSFALTSEKEDHHWRLLATYPLTTHSFMVGKFIGLLIQMMVILSFGYGLTGTVSVFSGSVIRFSDFLLFFLFASVLTILYLSLALLLGAWCKNRWQALVAAVATWFFTVVGWSTMLIAGISLLPYQWVKPVLVWLTVLNPAELSRLFAVIQLGGGSILGPEYYEWVSWANRPWGAVLLMTFVVTWFTIFMLLANAWWKRGVHRV